MIKVRNIRWNHSLISCPDFGVLVSDAQGASDPFRFLSVSETLGSSREKGMQSTSIDFSLRFSRTQGKGKKQRHHERLATWGCQSQTWKLSLHTLLGYTSPAPHAPHVTAHMSSFLGTSQAAHAFSTSLPPYKLLPLLKRPSLTPALYVLTKHMNGLGGWEYCSISLCTPTPSCLFNCISLTKPQTFPGQGPYPSHSSSQPQYAAHISFMAGVALTLREGMDFQPLPPQVAYPSDLTTSAKFCLAPLVWLELKNVTPSHTS